MAVAEHLRELQNKHAIIDQQIRQELKHPQPDAALISTLKKQKLQLKDQIHAYQSEAG